MSMAATVLVEVPKVTPGFIQEQFLGIVVYLLPAMLVAFGAFLDAVKHSVLGLVVLWIGGLLLTLWLLVGVFGGVLYVYGLVGGLAMLAPAIPAVGFAWRPGSKSNRFCGSRCGPRADCQWSFGGESFRAEPVTLANSVK